MKKNLKILTLLVLGVFLMGALTGCVGQRAVGVIDVDQVVAKSQTAQKYQEQLSEKGKQLTQRLQASKETGEAKEKEQQQAYNEFIQTKQELEQKLDQEMKKAVEEVAKEKKLSAVLHKKEVRYGGVDITQNVIEKLK